MAITYKDNGLVPDDVFMSRRDQIAALAMSGILAGVVTSGNTWTAENAAQAAVDSAEALIEKLDEE